MILILTDDQGYGDYAGRGNTVLRTPHIDRLAAESVELVYFYVSPVCTPARAALMTGRNHLRSAGVTLMHPAEWTLGEMFAADAYRTGIFGKWNLGDNHPQRPSDQGFHEALVSRGASISAISDPLHGSYFDPLLWKNGRAVKQSGYVTDVLTSAACEFISAAGDEPFFVYLPYNCPHNPLEAPREYLDLYADADVSSAALPEVGRPFDTGQNPAADEAKTRRLYGMVANIDDNIGRLLRHLDDLGIAEHTIVVYLSDNGPQHRRWNAGLRGIKGSVYEGGLRTPCWVRWPGTLPAGRLVESFGAHVDLAPTLLEACGIAAPPRVRFDGRSLWPLISAAPGAESWPDRSLVFQWHVGDEPMPWRACAIRSARYKLVQAVGVGQAEIEGRRRYELFEPAVDPYELDDLASAQPEIVEALKSDYDAWFEDARSERCFALPRIDVGLAVENPIELTRQDLRGLPSEGFWNLEVQRAGPYTATLTLGASERERELLWRCGATERRVPLPAGTREVVLEDIELPVGPGRLQALVQDGERRLPVWLVRLSW